MAISLNCNKNDIQQQSANISYSASGYNLPSNGSKSQVVVDTDIRYLAYEWVYEYSDLTYTWSFSPGGTVYGNSGNIEVSGLNAGDKTTIIASITVTCTQTITTYITEGRADSEGNWTWENHEPYSSSGPYTITSGESSSIDIYTKSETFSWPTAPQSEKTYIVDVLTAEKWNELAKKASQYKSWNLQNDNYIYNDRVKSGDFISANEYNYVANLLETSEVKAGDLIAADLFIRLSDKVNG